MLKRLLLLDVLRAQAEAVDRVVHDWQPPEDMDRRARAIEQAIPSLLEFSPQAKKAVDEVFASMPRDGTLLDYLNRHREGLADHFRFALEASRKLRDHAWNSEKAGQSVPSLPLLERVIRDLERLESETLSHWLEFDPKQAIGPDENYISHDKFLRFLESQMSEEARRELQGRLAPVGS